MNPIFVVLISAVFLIGINGNPVILARTEKSKPREWLFCIKFYACDKKYSKQQLNFIYYFCS